MNVLRFFGSANHHVVLFFLAIGILNGSGCGSSSQNAYQSEPPVSELPVQQIPVRVHTMTCVNGCFNGIKSVLEKRSGIEDVSLVPQKTADEIDDSTIIVSYRGNLNRKEIERTILGAGFERIEFLESR
jgi:copper chaperone CopZ